MKIAVIGLRGFPEVQGGIEYHCEQLYTHLVELGCEITVFTRKPYVDSSLRTYKGVTLIPVDCPRSKYLENIIHSFSSVLKARKQKPDILHIHSSFIFALLARFFGMKAVLTIHCQSYKHKKWGLLAKLFVWFNEAFGVLFADRVIAISRPIASALQTEYHKPVEFIPNGIRMSELLTTENTLLRFGISKHKYILYVGRIVAGKGLEDLIDAFNNANLRDWKLVIVGRADHEDKYSQDLREKAQKNTNIILTGFLTGSALQEIYSHAGLFILPSYYEGLPIALLEAMSYGLSCLASDIPANKAVDLSEDRFFKVGDIKSLTAKIKEFVDKPLTEDEKTRQISMIAEKYSWQNIADKTLEVYKGVLSKKLKNSFEKF